MNTVLHNFKTPDTPASKPALFFWDTLYFFKHPGSVGVSPNAAYFLYFRIARPWERRRPAGSQMRIPAITESAKGRLLAGLLASNGCDARK
jgi:hypothetical protein